MTTFPKLTFDEYVRLYCLGSSDPELKACLEQKLACFQNFAEWVKVAHKPEIEYFAWGMMLQYGETFQDWTRAHHRLPRHLKNAALMCASEHAQELADWYWVHENTPRRNKNDLRFHADRQIARLCLQHRAKREQLYAARRFA